MWLWGWGGNGWGGHLGASVGVVIVCWRLLSGEKEERWVLMGLITTLHSNHLKHKAHH